MIEMEEGSSRAIERERERDGSKEKELEPGLTYPNRGLTLESLHGSVAVEATIGESSKSPTLCRGGAG